MSPDEHRALRNRLGLSAGAEARLLGVGRRTVERWDSGNRPVSGEGLRLLRLLELELDTKASLRVRGVRKALIAMQPSHPPVSAYVDISFQERPCDRCGNLYRGPAVYCSLACAIADA